MYTILGPLAGIGITNPLAHHWQDSEVSGRMILDWLTNNLMRMAYSQITLISTKRTSVLVRETNFERQLFRAAKKG